MKALNLKKEHTVTAKKIIPPVDIRVVLNFFEEYGFYFPIQNLLKIFPSKSSVVISPVISPR